MSAFPKEIGCFDSNTNFEGRLYLHRGLGPNAPVPKGFRYREFYVYLPSGCQRGRKHPLLLVLDGQNAFGHDSARDWKLIDTVDRLSARGAITPPIVVGVSHGTNRLREYIGWSKEPGHRFAAGDHHHHFLVDHLIPFLKAHYPVRLRPRSSVILGASAGGVAALYTAFENSENFAGVGLLSAGRHYLGELLERFPNGPLSIPKIYVSCGDRGMDEELLPAARDFAHRAKSKGGEVRFRLRKGAYHVESAWTKVLPDALSYFFMPH